MKQDSLYSTQLSAMHQSIWSNNFGEQSRQQLGGRILMTGHIHKWCKRDGYQTLIKYCMTGKN